MNDKTAVIVDYLNEDEAFRIDRLDIPNEWLKKPLDSLKTLLAMRLSRMRKRPKKLRSYSFPGKPESIIRFK